MMASAKPRTNMISASTIYMMPIFLWSTEVNHSCHSQPHSRYFVSAASTARPPRATTAKVAQTIGSFGIASQFSRPRRKVVSFENVAMLASDQKFRA